MESSKPTGTKRNSDQLTASNSTRHPPNYSMDTQKSLFLKQPDVAESYRSSPYWPEMLESLGWRTICSTCRFVLSLEGIYTSIVYHFSISDLIFLLLFSESGKSLPHAEFTFVRCSQRTAKSWTLCPSVKPLLKSRQSRSWIRSVSDGNVSNLIVSSRNLNIWQ